MHQTKEEIRQDGNSSLADNLVELSATFNLSERSTTLLSPPPLYYTASGTPLETHWDPTTFSNFQPPLPLHFQLQSVSASPWKLHPTPWDFQKLSASVHSIFQSPLTLTLYIRHPPWDPYHTPKSNSTQNCYHLHHHQHVHHLQHQHVHHLNQAVPHHRQQHYQLVYLQFVLSAKKSPIIATTTNKISFLPPMIFFIIANYICQNEFCQNCQWYLSQLIRRKQGNVLIFMAVRNILGWDGQRAPHTIPTTIKKDGFNLMGARVPGEGVE